MKTAAALIVALCMAAGCGTLQSPRVQKQQTGILNPDKKILPGKSIGRLALGMTSAEVAEIMGQPSQVLPYEEEKTLYLNYGYSLDTELPFYIGFDSYYQYDKTAGNRPSPVWKVYFNDDRAVLINVSSYIYPLDENTDCGVSADCRMGEPMQKIPGTLGNGFLYNVDEANNQNYYYLEKGILVIAVQDSVRVFHIFAPLSPAKSREFGSRLSSTVTKKHHHDGPQDEQ